MTTGKNKVEFKEFYETITGGNYKIPYQNFMAYPSEMQKGVYEAYYDSVGYYIDVEHNEVGRKFHYRIWFKPMRDDLSTYSIYKTRLEAFAEALIMADKLRNEQLNR